MSCQRRWGIAFWVSLVMTLRTVAAFTAPGATFNVQITSSPFNLHNHERSSSPVSNRYNYYDRRSFQTYSMSNNSTSSDMQDKSFWRFPLPTGGNVSILQRLKRDYQRDRAIDSFLLHCRSLSPLKQFGILLTVYAFHLKVLTQHCIVFPFQLIPNDHGRFQSIGLDSLAGILSFILIELLRRRQLNSTPNRSHSVIPPLFSTVHSYDGSAPWKFPIPSSSYSSTGEQQLGPRTTSCVSLGLLVAAYFMTGRISAWIELNLYALAGLGFPMTIAMHRSLVVLGGHLAWVLIGSGILSLLLRPRPFFGGGQKSIGTSADQERRYMRVHPKTGGVEEQISKISSSRPPPLQKYRWYSNNIRSNWLWWTMGGYFISSLMFNFADFLNQAILPAHIFEQAGEGVVSQLINPENNDFLASLVGYIAPCLSAPWWEEVLYRGFLLPALCLQMNFWAAVFVSGIIFSVHHVSTTGAIPLAILGWTWATLYAKSGNLIVTILIHFMWNSRVFLGSWLGL